MSICILIIFVMIEVSCNLTTREKSRGFEDWALSENVNKIPAKYIYIFYLGVICNWVFFCDDWVSCNLTCEQLCGFEDRAWSENLIMNIKFIKTLGVILWLVKLTLFVMIYVSCNLTCEQSCGFEDRAWSEKKFKQLCGLI